MPREYYLIVLLEGHRLGWPIFTPTPSGPVVAVFTTPTRVERFRVGRGFGREWRVARLRGRQFRRWLGYNQALGILRVVVNPKPGELERGQPS